MVFDIDFYMINILNKQIGINKTAFLNLLSAVFLQGIAFLTIPIFTRVLGSEQFGLYAIFNSWTSIFSICISLSIGNCIGSGKYYFKDEYLNFRNNLIVFNTIISIVVLLLLVLLCNQINLLLSYSFTLYIVLLLTSFSTNTIGLISGILIYEKKALLNLILSIFLSLTNVALSLYLIYNVKFNNIYEGRVYGHFIVYFSATIFLIVYIITTKPFKISLKFLMYGLSVGTPVTFHLLAHYILGQSDRVMMQKMGVESTEIGIYSLFYSFCSVLTILLGALNTSYSPFYYEYIDNDDRESIISKSKNIIELFTITCVGFLLLSREVSYVMADKEYYSGIDLIPIIVVAIYFNFMYLFPVNYEFFYRKTKTIALGTIGAAILNIILNCYFINKYGIFGAAYATLLSYASLFIFHYIIASILPEHRFYISLKYYIFGLSIVALFSLFFYILSSQVIIRWSVGALIGFYELYKIVKRKAIF